MGYTGEQKKEYQRRWMAERRQSWIASEGGRCVLCGSTENLEIDHIDPSNKRCHVSVLWSRKAEVRLAELAKCQLLCETCHLAKTTAQQLTAEHGSASMYQRHGCRCNLCRAWKSASDKKYR